MSPDRRISQSLKNFSCTFSRTSSYFLGFFSSSHVHVCGLKYRRRYKCMNIGFLKINYIKLRNTKRPFTNPFRSHLILLPSFKMRIRLFYSRLTPWKNDNMPTAPRFSFYWGWICNQRIYVIYLDFKGFYNTFNNIELCLFMCLFWSCILKGNDFPNSTTLWIRFKKLILTLKSNYLKICQNKIF